MEDEIWAAGERAHGLALYSNPKSNERDKKTVALQWASAART